MEVNFRAGVIPFAADSFLPAFLFPSIPQYELLVFSNPGSPVLPITMNVSGVHFVLHLHPTKHEPTWKKDALKTPDPISPVTH